VVTGERTPEQRMQARSARLEKLNSICEWRDSCCVTAGDRKKLHLQMKIHTNHFETWLVETAHPGGVNMPDRIKLAIEKGPNHPKYKMPVNLFITLADALMHTEKQAQIPSSMLSLLDKLIDERGLYSHLMAHPQIATVGKDSQEEYDNHQHFIDVMEDVRTILSHKSTKKPQIDASQSTSAANPANATIQKHNSTLGKRKPSLTGLAGTEQQKAVKTASTLTVTSPTPQRPMYVLGSDNKPTTATMKSRGGGIEKTCAAAAKPAMSWAAIASASIAV